MPSSSSSNPDWPLLPDEILVDILGRFETIRDFFAVRAVCRSWRSAASPSPSILSSQSPLLFLSSPFSESIYDIATRRLYSFRLPWTGTPHITHFYAYGQLITCAFNVFDGFYNIVFSDLFTAARVRLPRHPHRADCRVIISARPDSAECNVVLFRSHLDLTIIQYLNASNNRWTVASSPHKLVDMMFHRGELFALNHDLDLLRVELTGDDTLIVGRLGDGRINRTGKRHFDFRLSELDGVILLVVRMFVFPTVEFDVFRWNLVEEKWEEIRDLGADKSLFLSTFGDAVSFPVTGLGLRNNSVYIVNLDRGELKGFSLTDRSWETVNIHNANLPKSRSHSAVWVFPNRC